ncbi:MAG: REP-associated tyrosine transposase [Burkholderiales bacterium]
MSRPLRLELSGGLYHVTSRGDRREDIYLDDLDRETWLEVLSQVCERYHWAIHAWCQMTNHYHLVIETPEGNLSAGMRQLNGVYTQKVNSRHRRVGHVFQGRFKGILVERDSYLLELARYVVLNPVRAGMVRQVHKWKWNSYHAMLGTAPCPAWLQTGWLLGQFGSGRIRQIERYVQFVQEGVRGAPIWDQLKGQVFLGSETFVQLMQRELEAAAKHTDKEIPRMQRRALAKSLDYYKNEFDDTKTGMAAAYATGDHTLQAIADAFGVHYSTVSRAVNGR